MVGSTNENVPLREYMEAQFGLRDRALVAALAAQEKAVEAALAAANAKFDKSEADARRWQSNANEWRASMLDREEKFVQKAVYEETIEGLRLEVRRKNYAATMGYAAGFVGLLGGLIAIVLTVVRFFGPV